MATTMKVIWQNVVKHGKDALPNFEKFAPKKKYGAKVWNKVEKEKQSAAFAFSQRGSQGIKRKDGIISRFLSNNATKTLASEMRERFALGLHSLSGSYSLYGVLRRNGSRLSRLAFVNVCFAGGLQWNENSQFGDSDTICNYIKDIFKDHAARDIDHKQTNEQHGTSVAEYGFGDIIAKGSNAVVYEAKMRDDNLASFSICEERTERLDSTSTIFEFDTFESTATTSDSIYSFEMVEDFSEEMAEVSSTESSIEVIESPIDDEIFFEPVITKHVPMPKSIATMENSLQEVDFNLAIKMMFNYDIESNAQHLFHHMKKELVPLQTGPGENNIWLNKIHVKMKLPPHPNIVVMKEAFADDTPALSRGLLEYPDALPQRLNRGGYGRNKTLFIVMKKYDCTLENYIEQHQPSVEESFVILTQILEGVLHLNQHGIAHRDLKTNNLLLDLSITSDWPSLVVSDFGCCTTEGMQIPLQTDEVNRGGNPLLMAPEIARAKPGWNVSLDYNMADLWAVGAIAYEIFGGENPFYSNNPLLDTMSYDNKDLPTLPNHVPPYMSNIVKLMLQTDQHKRPDIILLLDIFNFLMWCPESWHEDLTAGSDKPSMLELRRWLMMLSAETMLQNRLQESADRVEQSLRHLFLCRLDMSRLCEAVDILWRCAKEK